MFINSASNSDFAFCYIVNKVPFRKHNIDFCSFKRFNLFFILQAIQRVIKRFKRIYKKQ